MSLISTAVMLTPHCSTRDSRISWNLGVDLGALGEHLVELHPADDRAQRGRGELPASPACNCSTRKDRVHRDEISTYTTPRSTADRDVVRG